MFPDCDKCDKSKQGHVDESGEWKWGDCNDNINYGMTFAERFIDSAERYVERIRRSKKKYFRKKMNLHNNKAGRLVRNFLFWMAYCKGGFVRRIIEVSN